MHKIHITPVTSPAALSEFVDFPWKIYGDARHPRVFSSAWLPPADAATSPAAGGLPSRWVPPLKMQERELMDTHSGHPFWQEACGQLFLARRGTETVGRIAAVVDEKYNAYAQDSCGAWGFFECLEDREAAEALFQAAADWLKAQGMTHLRGPLNPSTNYTCGVLVQGFTENPAVMMPWNPPYYAALMEGWGMRKEQDLFAYTIDRAAFTRPEWLQKQLAVLHERGEFTCRTSSRRTLEADIHTMLDIYQASWAKNWGFVPMSAAEAAHHVKDLKSVLDPEFFVLFFHNRQGKEEPAGGMIALPDMTPLLRRLDGSLSLSTLWHYFAARKAMRTGWRVILFGLREEFRMAGLPFLLVDFLLKQAEANPDFQWLEGSWLLEDNAPICDLMEDFGGRITKRYRIYRKELES